MNTLYFVFFWNYGGLPTADFVRLSVITANSVSVICTSRSTCFCNDLDWNITNRKKAVVTKHK